MTTVNILKPSKEEGGGRYVAVPLLKSKSEDSSPYSYDQWTPFGLIFSFIVEKDGTSVLEDTLNNVLHLTALLTFLSEGKSSFSGAPIPLFEMTDQTLSQWKGLYSSFVLENRSVELDSMANSEYMVSSPLFMRWAVFAESDFIELEKNLLIESKTSSKPLLASDFLIQEIAKFETINAEDITDYQNLFNNYPKDEALLLKTQSRFFSLARSFFFNVFASSSAEVNLIAFKVIERPLMMWLQGSRNNYYLAKRILPLLSSSAVINAVRE